MSSGYERDLLLRARRKKLDALMLKRYKAFAGSAKSEAETDALIRKYTLYARKVFGDETVDTRTSLTANSVFVGGRYHHILHHPVFYAFRNEYHGEAYHTVTGVHFNMTYHSINVQISGFYNRWFYIPKRFYRYHGSADPNPDIGDEVVLKFDVTKKKFKIIDWLPRPIYTFDKYPPTVDVLSTKGSEYYRKYGHDSGSTVTDPLD